MRDHYCESGGAEQLQGEDGCTIPGKFLFACVYSVSLSFFVSISALSLSLCYFSGRTFVSEDSRHYSCGNFGLNFECKQGQT